MNEGVVYLNGEFMSAADARIGVFDGGWLHGAGLFETMRAESGRIFRVETHIDRLRQSAAKLLRPVERVELPSRVDFMELLDRNSLIEARVRLTVSAGELSGEGGWTICATASPLAMPDARLYQG